MSEEDTGEMGILSNYPVVWKHKVTGEYGYIDICPVAAGKTPTGKRHG